MAEHGCKSARCMPPMLSSAAIVEISFAFDPMLIWAARRAQKMRNPSNASKWHAYAAIADYFRLSSRTVLDERIHSIILSDADDRQVAHGLFDQLCGAVARRIEEQRVTGSHH